MTRADILIKNGRILDPANDVDKVGDVVVRGGRIVACGGDAEADAIIDATGCLVTPGLVDFHAHIFDRATDSGLNPDVAMLPHGVTTVVDAGSSGVANYRSFMDRLATYRIKTKLLLHVCPIGQSNHQFPEPLHPDSWSMDKFAAALETGGDKIHGFKVRISRNIVKEEGARVFYRALEAARRFDRPLVVHVTDSAVPLDEVADALAPGDVFCHVFQAKGPTILDADGRVSPAVARARARGVVMDACHGLENMSFAVAEAALAQGFLPSVISTDLTNRTWNKPPVYGMPHVMSKFRHLGMTDAQVVECVTAAPARILGLADRIGTLAEGSVADIAILKLAAGGVRFDDSSGETRFGDSRYVPMATVLDGVVVYRSHDFLDR